MKTIFVATVAIAGLCSAYPKAARDWKPSDLGDSRSPCPLLNALANHGYLPHGGRDLDRDTVLGALKEAVNIDRPLTDIFFQAALNMTVPLANATELSLHHLIQHNAIEHDASLSRPDAFFSSHQDVFDPAIFAETRSYWPDPVISVRQAAAARLGRLQTSNRTNPAFELNKTGALASVAETAIYLIAFGDVEAGTVRREYVEYLFEHERLPLELGWEKSKFVLTQAHLEAMSGRVVAETNSLLHGASVMDATADLQSPPAGDEL
ncbi:Cloroperoxidase [Apiospora rasikravindrae]|uniref:Cloroperoxidase n=1 Tax=Apiospora rasikravindrae TaxID=990691 RepID=A0ABR1U361_9PEZI